jgi:hypothetical protein
MARRRDDAHRADAEQTFDAILVDDVTDVDR